jgi:uncharacterized damage-inducible protein DinB
MIDDFAELAQERDRTDTEILSWAGQLTQEWLDAPLRYTRKLDGRVAQLDGWVSAVHFFNHGTHHRGQVTTLLKQAGVDPGVTDLPLLPGVSTLLEPGDA